MKMESQVWYAELAVELNPLARGSDTRLCGLVCAVGVKPLARGSDTRLVRARAEELLNNYKPPAIPSQALTGAGFREALAFILSFWASGRPDSPFSPCGRKGLGG